MSRDTGQIPFSEHVECSGCHGDATPAMSRRNFLAAAAVLAAVGAIGGGVVSQTPAVAAPPAGPNRLTWYQLVPGFVDVLQDEYGRPLGSGFVAANPWGAYTAYLVHVNDLGHRTWRVENMQQLAPRPDGSLYSQGSTMWLFEGSSRALLVDTAINTPDTPGVNDLVTVAQYLLGHNDDGTPRANAVDFDVAITHRHGDHTGKVSRMASRTVYYPDLDWTGAGSANWVPIRQGGGSTNNGSGTAVSQVDLGNRTIHAVAMYGHTPGSTGYLDAESRLLATGDAIGSAYVWAHFASATTSLYADMLRELHAELAVYRDLALLPAHFYQIRQFERSQPPINGKPLDLSYLKDMSLAADGALDGSIFADPYHEIGREAVWISGGSARMVYSLTNLYPGGPLGGNGDARFFHGVNIPSRYPQDPFLDGPYAFLDNIQTNLVMIRDNADESSYFIRGTERALLITSGRTAAGIVDYAKTIAGHGRIDVAILDGEPVSIAGLAQFDGLRLFAPAGVSIPTRKGQVTALAHGDSLTLGKDGAGRTVALEVLALPGARPDSLTLLDAVSRVVFAGDALGIQGARGLVLSSTVAGFGTQLAAWRQLTDGRYDTLYTAHNHQWLTRPGYVASLATAAANAPATNQPRPGYRAYTSGSGELLAWIFEPV